MALVVMLGALSVGGIAQADGDGCIGDDDVASACVPCDFSEWHAHVLGQRVGTGIRCIP